MTHDDALTVTTMVLNSWAKPDWTEGQTEAFVNTLVEYDAEHMTNAVAAAHKHEEFRPTFATLYKYYRAVKQQAATDGRNAAYEAAAANRVEPVYTDKLPQWVKEWVCARYLHKAFGRAQDMRVFPQQRDWSPADAPMMPPGEWEKEGAALTDSRAWQALRSAQ